MELLKDYDISILYYLSNVNVVEDALSWKAFSMGSLTFLKVMEISLDLIVHSMARQIV